MSADCTRVLSLDGGGAKGFYTLGVLREIETIAGAPLHQHFRLIFGTSTGSIIAALLARGRSVNEIYELYRDNVPKLMSNILPSRKSQALKTLADNVFGSDDFSAFKTDIGIVTTNYRTERPMIFKSSADQLHSMKDSFVPGFGCTISDAVQASCSAYPFFLPKRVITAWDDSLLLVDGGYCANNPTLYVIAEALMALNVPADRLRVLSVGVGTYPLPARNPLNIAWWLSRYPGAEFFKKTLEINTQSMDQLQRILYPHIDIIRISQSYHQQEMATDLLEKDLIKLNVLRQRGADSVREHEGRLRAFFS